MQVRQPSAPLPPSPPREAASPSRGSAGAASPSSRNRERASVRLLTASPPPPPLQSAPDLFLPRSPPRPTPRRRLPSPRRPASPRRAEPDRLPSSRRPRQPAGLRAPPTARRHGIARLLHLADQGERRSLRRRRQAINHGVSAGRRTGAHARPCCGSGGRPHRPRTGPGADPCPSWPPKMRPHDPPPLPPNRLSRRLERPDRTGPRVQGCLVVSPDGRSRPELGSIPPDAGGGRGPAGHVYGAYSAARHGWRCAERRRPPGQLACRARLGSPLPLTPVQRLDPPAATLMPRAAIAPMWCLPPLDASRRRAQSRRQRAWEASCRAP